MISFLLALAITGTPPSPHPTLSPSLRFDSAIRACSDTDGLAWALNTDRGTGVVYSASHQMDACVNGARIGRWTSAGLDVTGTFTVNGAAPAPAFPLLAPAGSTSAPSYSWSGDPSAGIYYAPDAPFPITAMSLRGGAANLIKFDSFVYNKVGNAVFSDANGLNAYTIFAANLATLRYFVGYPGNASTTVVTEWKEDAAPSAGVAGRDEVYADSTAHALRLSNNNGAFATVATDTTGGAAGQVLFRDSATASFKSDTDFAFAAGTLSLGKTGEFGILNLLRSSDGALAAQVGLLPVSESSYVSSTKDFEIFSNGSVRFTVDGTSSPSPKITSTLPIVMNEGTPLTPAAASAILSADATSHTLQLSNNGDAYDSAARETSSVAAGDTTESAGALTTATTTTVQVGNYQCHGSVVLSESVSTEGAKCALTKLTGTLGSRSQGSAILTSTTANTGDAAVDHGASMNPSVALSVFPAGTCIVDAFLSVSAAGTIGLQIAQNAHTAGTLTGFAGANLLCTRM